MGPTHLYGVMARRARHEIADIYFLGKPLALSGSRFSGSGRVRDAPSSDGVSAYICVCVFVGVCVRTCWCPRRPPARMTLLNKRTSHAAHACDALREAIPKTYASVRATARIRPLNAMRECVFVCLRVGLRFAVRPHCGTRTISTAAVMLRIDGLRAYTPCLEQFAPTSTT